MTDPAALAADLQLGREAQEALNNGVLKQAFEDIETNTIVTWSEENDPVVREDLWQLLRALRLIRRYLQSAVGSGRLAGAEMEGK